MANFFIIGLAVLLAVIPISLSCDWINEWDGPLHFQCWSKHQFVSHIESIHDNHKEDRRYKMSCRYIPSHARRSSTNCFWTGYLNSYDKVLNYKCGCNGYINGFQSVHSNHHEDRIWKVRCCRPRGLRLYDCRWTGFTNWWDQRQNYNAPYGQVTNGVWSKHCNQREDRRWKYRTCKIKKCTEGVGGTCGKCAEEENEALEITDDFEPKEVGVKSMIIDALAFDESSVEPSFTDTFEVEESKEDVGDTEYIAGDEMRIDERYPQVQEIGE